MARISWKWLAVAGALAIAAVAGTGAYWYRPLTVVALQPEQDVAIRVFGLGTMEARVLARIGFKVSGTLTDLRVDHGDRVKAGQLLARMDDREQQARTAKAKAQLSSAEAAIQVSEAAARKAAAVVTQRMQANQRRQTLLAREATSAQSAEDAQLNEDVAKADLLVAQSEIQSAKAKLDDARAQHEYESVILGQHELRAPFDGIIIVRAKELGSVLASGEALFTLVAPETVWILAYVDETRSGNVEVGQPAEIKLRSLPQQIFKGHVARIGIESDRVNEERRIYVACKNCPLSFFIGEQAEVFITTAVLDRALMVPEAAIEQFDGTTGIVWTIEDGRLSRRRVSFGKRSLDGRIEVSGGLPEGVAIATTIAPGFRETRQVRVALEQAR
jgi:HlyD family secretion protein